MITSHIKHNKALEEGNLDEVCTFLRISERTLQRLRTNGVISYSVISGKTYYIIAEIK
ncbi:helix-turn-helix domain-containing protein [Dysgonomonas sp. ZJ709]|uniref:helix-turn-helix domain-containing protein n=1 Tax=Dysgonomonas sp. ZJ709 TaxID=2709797 RepID=UPI00351A5E2B